MSSNERISELFRRTIFQGLEKVDISQAHQRQGVYEAALKSLNNVQSKNHNLADNVKIHQRNILSDLIIEIETKIAHLNDENNAQEIETAPVSLTDENDFLLDDDINETGKKRSFFDNLHAKFSASKITRKHFIGIGVLAALCLSAFATFYINSDNIENSANALALPHVVTADEALLDFARVKENGLVRLSDSPEKGILYEVDVDGDDTTNRLDFVLRGDLGKKINALKEPVLATFHIQKISNEDVEVSFLFRGAGKIVRKTVKIVDENTNEFFLVTTSERGAKERANALIRLQISPTSEKFEEKPRLLLKKIVLSKI